MDLSCTADSCASGMKIMAGTCARSLSQVGVHIACGLSMQLMLESCHRLCNSRPRLETSCSADSCGADFRVDILACRCA